MKRKPSEIQTRLRIWDAMAKVIRSSIKRGAKIPDLRIIKQP